MPFIKGIGHIDESVKFMNRDTVIVDDPTYEQILKDAGYTTVKMPRPDNEYETYVNSLVVNGVVYVPVFGEKNDKKALQIYESFGLRAVPLDSTELSNDGMGSIHCITMVYPKVDFNEMLSAITLQDF
jgi:agmatine/peptidylarginine deiminase